MDGSVYGYVCTLMFFLVVFSTSLFLLTLFSSSLCNNQKSTIGGVLNSKTNTTAVVTLTMNQDKNVRTHARTHDTADCFVTVLFNFFFVLAAFRRLHTQSLMHTHTHIRLNQQQQKLKNKTHKFSFEFH